MATKGIDVSYAQGTINWQKVKGKVDFAMIRGGYGKNASQKDAQFEANYNGAKAAGVPIGVYHYSYATTEAGAKKEAEFCLSYLKGKKFEYPIAFDVEDSSISHLSKAELTAICKAFCSTVEKAGYYVVIYSSKSWLDSKLDMKALAAYDVWVAQWNSTCTYKGAYGMWQYSDKGSVDGISGRVDLDEAYKDYPIIIKNAGLNGYTKTSTKPKPTKPTTTKPAAKAYTKGETIKLNNTPLYSSATDKVIRSRKSGTYYIYDGIAVSGRYRITVKNSFCGKKPVALFVTGWVNKTDIK